MATLDLDTVVAAMGRDEWITATGLIDGEISVRTWPSDACGHYCYVSLVDATAQYYTQAPVPWWALKHVLRMFRLDMLSQEWHIAECRPQNAMPLLDEYVDLVKRRIEWIYFLASGELIKIGVSCDPESRVEGLASESPVPVELLAMIPGTRRLERVIHKRLARDRDHGEWFKATEDVKRIMQWYLRKYEDIPRGRASGKSTGKSTAIEGSGT